MIHAGHLAEDFVRGSEPSHKLAALLAGERTGGIDEDAFLVVRSTLRIALAAAAAEPAKKPARFLRRLPIQCVDSHVERAAFDAERRGAEFSLAADCLAALESPANNGILVPLEESAARCL